MGCSSGAGGKAAKGGGGAKNRQKLIYTDAHDSEKLSQEQRDRINLARYDMWQNARQYERETKPAYDVTLTKTQQDAWRKIKYDDDDSGLDKYSEKTLSALVKKSAYEADRAERAVANTNYRVEDDYLTTPAGTRVQRPNNFPDVLRQRQKTARDNNKVIAAWEKKTGKDIRGRVIESAASRRAEANNRRQAEQLFKGRK